MIHKTLLTLVLLSSTIFALDWEKSLKDALTKAEVEHKNVMVLVEGEHCRWCKKMKQQTLSDEGIEKRLKEYVVVKVMRHDSSTRTTLPKVSGVPTTFFMKADKTVIYELLGYVDVADFNTTLNDLKKRHK